MRAARVVGGVASRSLLHGAIAPRAGARGGAARPAPGDAAAAARRRARLGAVDAKMAQGRARSLLVSTRARVAS
eukprot:6682644-Pyramimonas_sp.AAC.1